MLLKQGKKCNQNKRKLYYVNSITTARGFHLQRNNYLAHVIEKPNLRILNPQYFLLFKWKFDDFFIHFEFDRGDKKTKCIHKSNVIKKIVVNIRDSEFVNLVFRWRDTPPLWRDLVKISTTKLWHTSSFLLECTDFKNVIFEKIPWAPSEVAEVAEVKQPRNPKRRKF